jgi:hypothetical protein
MDMWLFLSFGVVGVFSFLSVATWAGTRQQERKDFYRTEMLKKLAEAGSAAVVEYLHEEEKLEARRRIEQRERQRQGSLLGGLILIVVGVGLAIALYGIARDAPVYLFAIVPFGIGVVLLGTSLFGRRSG